MMFLFANAVSALANLHVDDNRYFDDNKFKKGFRGREKCTSPLKHIWDYSFIEKNPSGWKHMCFTKVAPIHTAMSIAMCSV